MLVTRAAARRIMPRAMESSTLPFDVSSEMAVVRVLVKPFIFPPTMMASPTSETARPKLSAMAEIIEYLASLIMAMEVCIGLAPRALAVSARALSTLFRLLIVKPRRIGEIKRACPIIITVGVNKSSRFPRGPVREKVTNTNSPTTTVGTL